MRTSSPSLLAWRNKHMKTKILFVIGFVLIAANIYFFVWPGGGFWGRGSVPAENGAGAGENMVDGLSLDDGTGNTTTPSLDRLDFNIYTNNDFGFSFELPKEYSVTNFPEDEAGEVILVQGPAAKEGGKMSGFQIFITEFDEEGPITPARIRQDLPDAVIQSPQTALIGPDKNIEALIYWSDVPSLGRTREAWFVYGGYVYQVTAYAEFDSLVGSMLATLTFNY